MRVPPQIRQWFTARGYEAVQYGQGIHDDYHKPPIFNFEIHSALFDVRAYPQWRDYLEHVEERFLPLEGTRYGRRFSQEDFFLYMMAHIYKHFCWGGTGLRSLVDCWVFSRARENSLDWAYLDAESRKMGMGDFVSQTQALAEGLFGKPRPLTDAERELLAYCLASGTYGTGQHLLENKLRSALDGGGKRGAGARLRYLCRRLFPRRDYLELWCGKFAPFFLRHPRLMPLAYPCRLARDFAHKAWKKGWRELRTLWKV